MKNIKLVALGGAAENGKNMYFLQYKEHGILFDAGLTNYDNKAIGIDSLMPDISYLKDKHISAILISHGHMDQMGAINQVIKQHPNVPVYGSDYTIEFLKLSCPKDANLQTLKYDSILKINDFEIEPFRLSHAIFGNYGYLVNTPDGAIVYATDYNFNQTVSVTERTDIQKIVNFNNKYKILLLMTETIAIEEEGVAASGQEDILKFSNIVEHSNGKTIVSLYSSNVSGINNIIDVAEKLDKKICILGRDLLTYVNLSRRQGYLKHSKDRFKKLSDLKNIDPTKQLIIVSGLYEEPFKELEKVATGSNSLFTIDRNDTIIIASKPYDKIEGYAQSVNDKLARTMALIVKQKLNISSHAQKEDVKMMINLFQPRFIAPIKGEYRKQVQLEIEAVKLGYDNSQIVIMANGELIEIDQKEAVMTKKIDITDILIKNERNSQTETNPIVIRDREVLSQNGYLTIILTVDRNSKKLIKIPEIFSGGLSKFDDDIEIMESLQKIVKTAFDDNSIDAKKRQTTIRIKSIRYLENKIGKSPMVLQVLLEV